MEFLSFLSKKRKKLYFFSGVLVISSLILGLVFSYTFLMGKLQILTNNQDNSIENIRLYSTQDFPNSSYFPNSLFYCDSNGFTEVSLNLEGHIISETKYNDTLNQILALYIQNDLVFLADGDGGLNILRKTPTNQFLKISEFRIGGIMRDIIVNDDIAYCSNSEYGLLILNISIPSNPVLISSFCNNIVGWNSATAFGLDLDGDFIFMADWKDGVEILNISDPINPRLIGSYSESNLYVKDISVFNNRLYLACGNKGILVLNLENINVPTKYTQILENGDEIQQIKKYDNKLYFSNNYQGLKVIFDSDSGKDGFRVVFDRDINDKILDISVLNDVCYVLTSNQIAFLIQHGFLRDPALFLSKVSLMLSFCFLIFDQKRYRKTLKLEQMLSNSRSIHLITSTNLANFQNCINLILRIPSENFELTPKGHLLLESYCEFPTLSHLLELNLYYQKHSYSLALRLVQKKVLSEDEIERLSHEGEIKERNLIEHTLPDHPLLKQISSRLEIQTASGFSLLK